MVRNFKGVVKVADVQAEFDSLLNAINNKIDTYNSSLNIEDVDYNNGGPDLAAYGYTLSVGGLKAVLDAYDGAILGANVLRISNNQYIVSEGLYIKDRTVTKLPSKVLTGTGNKVYFNDTDNNYTFDAESPTEVLDDDINPGLSIYTMDRSLVADQIANNTLTLNNLQRWLLEQYRFQGAMGRGQQNLYIQNVVMGNVTRTMMYDRSDIYNPDTDCIFALKITLNYRGKVSDVLSVTVPYGIEIFLGNSPHPQSVVPLTNFERMIEFQSATDTKTYTLHAGETGPFPVTDIPDDCRVIVIYAIVTNANDVLTPTNVAGPNHSIDAYFYTPYYFNLSQSGGGEDNILISPINSNRISRLCNKPNAVNESIPDYKLTIESKNSGYTINGNQYLDNSTKGQFFSGSAGRNCAINLLGTQVAYHQWHGDRTDSYHEPINFLFVPKGIPNPYGGLSGETRFAMQKVFNYILKRPER